MKSEVLVILINYLLALLDLQVHGLIPNYKIQLLHAMLLFSLWSYIQKSVGLSYTKGHLEIIGNTLEH